MHYINLQEIEEKNDEEASGRRTPLDDKIQPGNLEATYDKIALGKDWRTDSADSSLYDEVARPQTAPDSADDEDNEGQFNGRKKGGGPVKRSPDITGAFVPRVNVVPAGEVNQLNIQVEESQGFNQLALVEARISAVEDKLDSIEGKVNKVDAIEQKLISMEEKFNLSLYNIEILLRNSMFSNRSQAWN